jgi:hypothetical protein
MKLQLFVFTFIALLFLATGCCFGKNKTSEEPEDMLQVLFEPDSCTNMTFIIYTNCPSEYTNVISNTNLFTPIEQSLLKEIFYKYKNVTTNYGPYGTALTGLLATNNYWVAHFTYTNTDAYEDIIFGDRSAEARHNGSYGDFVAHLGLPLAQFRAKGGDGYDVAIDISNDWKVCTFAQIRHGKVNGLFILFSKNNCETLLRCVDGKAVGNWLEWDTYSDNRLIEIKIKSHLDYFKYMTQEIRN